MTWVKKKVGPAVAKVSSVSDAETVLETGNTVVVGFFDKLEVKFISTFFGQFFFHVLFDHTLQLIY